ncbi:MAG: hypothetical protein ACOZIN_15090 [Myxococcota bacterium]
MLGPVPRVILLCGLLGAGLATGDDRAQRARDELERQLRQMMGDIPPPKVDIFFEGLDDPQFRLVEAEFTLDGAPLAAPSPDQLDAEGLHKLFSGELKPGEHTLVSQVVFTDKSSVVFSYTPGYKWKVGRAVKFLAQRGLEVKVVAVPELLSRVKDPKERFTLKHQVDAKMVAKLEDGTLAPPGEKKAEPPDAGVAETVAQQEKKPQAEEAEDTQPAPAEEKKRKPKKVAAAMGASEVKPAVALAPVEPEAPTVEAVPEHIDAGEAVAVATEEKPAPEADFPWLLVVGVGTVVAGVVLVLLSRRR